MESIFDVLEPPQTPGLFVAGTDTEVGKTVAACLIADQLRRRGQAAGKRIGVLKPMATGCRREREGLVSEDAESLAWAANLDPDIGGLDVVNPIRYRPPVAPAVAMELAGEESLDVSPLERALHRLDAKCDAIIVEGIGGLLVPLAPKPGRSLKNGPYETTLDLARAIGYPVVLVCRADLGTLNHTALSIQALRAARVPLAGLIINRFDADSSDDAMRTNPRWLAAHNKTRVLAVLPSWEGLRGREDRREIAWDVRNIDQALAEAIDRTDFEGVCRAGRRAS